jgi:hypothetical protein
LRHLSVTTIISTTTSVSRSHQNSSNIPLHESLAALTGCCETTQSKVTRQKLRRTARAANQNATCRQFPTLAPIARLPCLALPCPALAFPSHRNSTPLHSKSKARHGTARHATPLARA